MERKNKMYFIHNELRLHIKESLKDPNGLKWIIFPFGKGSSQRDRADELSLLSWLLVARKMVLTKRQWVYISRTLTGAMNIKFCSRKG